MNFREKFNKLNDGHDFEYFCADVLKRNDFDSIEVTQASNDYGIDVLAEEGLTSKPSFF